MKYKFPFIISIILTIILFTGCTDAEKIEVDRTPMELYEHGLDVVAVMNEMINSDSFLQLYTMGTDIHNVVADIRTGDYSSPAAIYELKVSKEELVALYTSEMDPDFMKGFSEELTAEVDKKMNGAVVSIINGMAGMEELAASSICTAEKLFVYEELKDNTLYLYMYENALPVVVSFVVGDHGAAEAVGSFLMLEDFKNADHEFIENYFGNFSIEVKALEMIK